MIDAVWNAADAAAEWISIAWNTVVKVAASLLEAAVAALGAFMAIAMLSHLLPSLAHVAGLLLLHLLGAPLWFVAALMFGC
jgi:hypothetical protein